MKHLTTQQTEDLMQRMSERTRQLAARVREELTASDKQHYRDIAGAVTDTADEALAAALVDMDTAIIDRHIVELRDLVAARERMKQGSYGVCMDCGDEVDFARLAAYPTAKRCLQCQHKRERGYAQPGRPTL